VLVKTSSSRLEAVSLVPINLPLGEMKLRASSSLRVAPVHRDVATSVATTLLDRIERRFVEDAGSIDDIMTDLMSELWILRRDADHELWEQILRLCAAHPLREIIHQDPFSARSFNKPRGYAGDAVMIDFIYSQNCRRLDEQEPVTPLGEAIFRYNSNTPACAAVRTRRDLVASMIDQICSISDHPRILSVACGHLREATLCRSVSSGNAGPIVALDQDQLSISVVDREVSEYGVVPICNSIKALFRGELAREKFDFIYSTGLYDYLDDRIAGRLTSRLFDMLNPGGRLLVANFVPDIWGAAYMEAFMDWRLIYRTSRQLDAMASDIPNSEIARRLTFTEKNSNIVFLEITRN
jgi:extracellular factor (EF) 3-hydroxypalmitic acid methyl ester biosynthesis protein